MVEHWTLNPLVQGSSPWGPMLILTLKTPGLQGFQQIGGFFYTS